MGGLAFPHYFSQLPSKTWVWALGAGLNVSLQNEPVGAPPENGKEEEPTVHRAEFWSKTGAKHFDWKMNFGVSL